MHLSSPARKAIRASAPAKLLSMPASTRSGAQQIELPEKFRTIRCLLDGGAKAGTLINIIGVVTDFRAPVQTRGTDWKCQISLYDHTTSEDYDERILFNIFWPQDEMPDASLGDIVVAFNVKVQLTSVTPSLITNKATEVFIYSSKKIPRPPANAAAALKRPIRKNQRIRLGQLENALVSTFFHSIQKTKLPTEAEFETLKLRSVAFAPRKKFKELRHISDQTFVDMVVQIVKEPFTQGDLCSFWVSDYTEHDAFYHFAFKGLSVNPHSYGAGLDVLDESGSQWSGPYGKRCLQVTCFEPHASLIQDQKLTLGDWVQLRNVQIKYGRNGANLEGFLREDRDSRGDKIQIARLSLEVDRECLDPRLKEALIRKRDYEKEKKAQIKSLKEAAEDGKKRKANVADLPAETKANSRSKRRQKRAQMQQKQETTPPETMKPNKATPSLNTQVKYEYQDKPVSTIKEILENPPSLTTTVEGEEVQLAVPFRNVNYRANVRIIDFVPSRLEDFTFAKTESEFDVLRDSESGSDSSAAEDSGSSNEDLLGPLSKTPRRWEWRFSLELEDAGADLADADADAIGDHEYQKSTIWVTVDNSAAQCLIDLDASNLAEDADALEALRQRMFLIWGELEEKKTKELLEKQQRFARGHGPPADSDDEGEQQHDNNHNHNHNHNHKHKHKQRQQQRDFINRPFGCCIKEYGFKVPEPDPCKADAGEGKRWQRAFGLFGTRITD